ncbi:MAG: hypothetical protein FJ398_15215 [Verrucomicrobia bacterium]|nr:hypothetical protein [Verrucomicrobiota bacterium]
MKRSDVHKLSGCEPSKRLARWVALAGTVVWIASVHGADDSFHLVAESPSFPLDTRSINPDSSPQATRLVAESDPFPLDTRPRSGEQTTPATLVAESAPFPLDTRPITPDAAPTQPQATRPALAAMIDGRLIELYWPESAKGFVLEAAAAVESAPWARVTESPAVTGGRFRISLPLSSEARFFRLRREP